MAPTPSSAKGNQTQIRTPQSRQRLNFTSTKITTTTAQASANPNSTTTRETPPQDHPIEVVGRIRNFPNPNSKEKPVSVLQINPDKQTVRVRADVGYRDFSLDGVSLSEEEDLETFYKKFVESRIKAVKLGEKCTIMMYGPTGSGKSHTMFGCAKQPGIVYRSLRDILGEESYNEEKLGFGTFVQVTVLEIYNEEIYDLLSNNNGGGGGFGIGWPKGNASKVRLEVMGKKAKNATFISGTEAGKISKEVQKVEKRRIVKSTQCNERSSRSHCMIILDVPTVGGRLMLVDMAGSENIDQAGQTGFEAKMQTAKINQGNIALKRVVESIANGDSHVPFRDSKLTMLLQDSFEDDKSKILMILCASPDPKEIHKTVCTLEYGAKAKCIIRGPHTPIKDKTGAEDSSSTVILGSRIAAMDQFIYKLQMENKLREKERNEAHQLLLKKEEEVAALRAKLEIVQGKGSIVSEQEINSKVNERTQTLKLQLEKKLEECQRMAEEFVDMERRRMEERILQQIQQEVNPVFGVRKEVERLTNSFQAIKDVLVDAEERQVKDTSVRAWLCRLNDVSYNAEDVLDKWNTSMLKLQIERAENALTLKKKVCFFLSHCICFRQAVLHHDISGKIREINESLDDIAKDKERYNFNILQSVEQPQGVESISFIDEHTVYGRDQEKKLFISKLTCESSDEHHSLKIISIVGMGGMGKTTLAQLAYNDNEVKFFFQKRIWVCVSNPFNKLRVANAILHGLEGQTSSSATLQSALEKIHQSIVQKKILFVLDDVWTEDYNDWEPLYNCLKNCLNGSKILVTTRNEKVALMMKSIVIPIKELAENEIWSLFKHFAFYNWSHDERRELEDVGMEIVSKCKGLPLAAKTMGSLLHFKRTRREWKIILDSEMWVLKEFEKNIFAPLLLSYYDLPPMVKRCFLYCVIFPKDYQLDEEELIKLWMAQGYLKGERNSTKEMEMIGADYLNILYTRSFFMKDQICTTKRLKIHDIVHDFAQFLTNNESFAMNDKDFVASSINLSFEKVHHLMLMVDNSSSFPNSICNFKKLRSLLMKFESGMYSIDGVLLQLLSQNTSLRALALCGTFEYESMINKISMRVVAVAKIPREIGKLICLRYLDLSNNWGLEMLPETICELYNLQTLNVSWCQNLKELPQGMGKLINLRHLENEQTNSLRYMPKGIEKLTCLRTLNEFHVSECNYGRKACSLECLNKFHHLEGLLGIHGLGNLTDVNEAQKIDLANKENIRGLRLGFNGFNSRKNEAIFEALQPPPNLRGLHVLKYAGNTMLPNWPTSLINLTRLDLIEWINCEQLPQLGKLPSLQTLCIERMKKVKRVGHELLGLESDEITSSLSVTVFPQLQYLYFWRMVEWEEWDFGIENHNIIVMPSLHTLEIAECPKLKVLPKEILHVPPQVLSINNSPVVRDRYRKLEGDHWSEISHIPNIVIDEEYIQRDGR